MGSLPDWRLELYSNPYGPVPADEFLDSLQRGAPKEYRRALAKFKLFEQLGLQGALESGLVESLKGLPGIYELKIKRTGIRFYCFAGTDPAAAHSTLFVVAGESKGGKAASTKLLAVTSEAQSQWQQKHRIRKRPK